MRKLTKLALVSILVLPVMAFADNSAVQLAGIWKVEGIPDAGVPVAPFVNIATISSDGTITNIDPTFGAGVGTIRKVPGNQFAISFFHLVPGGSILEVQGSVTDHTADAYSAPFTTTFRDMDGNIQFSFTGTVYGTRLSQ